MTDAKAVLASIADAVKTASDAHSTAVTTSVNAAVEAAWNRVHAKFVLQMQAAFGYGEDLFPKKSAAEIKESRALFPDCTGWVDGEFPVFKYFQPSSGKYATGLADTFGYNQQAMTNFGRFVRQIARQNEGQLNLVRSMPRGDIMALTSAQLEAIQQIASELFPNCTTPVNTACNNAQHYGHGPNGDMMVGGMQPMYHVQCPPLVVCRALKVINEVSPPVGESYLRAKQLEELKTFATQKAALETAKAEFKVAQQIGEERLKRFAAYETEQKAALKAVAQELKAAALRIGDAAELETDAPPAAKVMAAKAIATLDEVLKK